MRTEKERTLAIIKPDAFCQKVIGRVITLIEENNLKIVAMKMILLNRKKAMEFYKEHKGKHFYRPLLDFMSSNPCIPIVVEGKNAIKKLRKLCGNTNPDNARYQTIRRMYARDGRHNIIHASDSPKSAKREINFFFKKSEIFSWKPLNYKI